MLLRDQSWQTQLLQWCFAAQAAGLALQQLLATVPALCCGVQQLICLPLR